MSRQYTHEAKTLNRYRDYGHLYSQLRTFKVSLFFEIDEKDLQDDDGQWFKIAYDDAIYYPIF
jgi:hypothetical protein